MPQLISQRETYCLRHRPKRDTAVRGSGAARRRFRQAVFVLANGQCEVMVDGVRCEVRDPASLEAHHLRGVKAGNDPINNGILVCVEDHALLEGWRAPDRVRRRGQR